MKALRATTIALLVALALKPVASRAQSGQSQAAPPSNSQSQNPPAKAKKPPEEPIDPDTTAGVRGNGFIHTVRVLRKGQPAEGAHVVVKNANGSVAATCFTNADGECQVDIGADRYTMVATRKNHAGAVSMQVTDATGTIVIKLKKVDADSPTPKT